MDKSFDDILRSMLNEIDLEEEKEKNRHKEAMESIELDRRALLRLVERSKS